MEQKINAQLTSFLYDDAFLKSTGIDPSIDFSEVLKNHEDKIKVSLNNHLLDSMILFDSALCLYQSVVEILDSAVKINNENITYLVLSSKIFSLMLGMRKMIFAGSPDSFKCLLRPLLESLDTFYTSLINPEFSKEYGNVTALYDNNEFWYKKGKGPKIRKFIHQLYRLLGADNDFIAAFDSRREYQQKFLSESLHSSFNASFSTFFTLTLDGELRHLYGDVTIAYPALLLETIDEASNFHYILQTLCNDEIINLPFIQNFKDNVLYNYRCEKFGLLYQQYRPALAQLKDETNAGFREISETLSSSPPQN